MTRMMPRFGIRRPMILVADRSGIARTVVREMLVRRGFRVLTAGTAKDAVRITLRFASLLHAIVAESVSNTRAGNDLATELARCAPQVPVLAMINPQHVAGQLEQANLIVKPFTQALLLFKVEQLLGKQAEAEGSTPPILYKTASLAS